MHKVILSLASNRFQKKNLAKARHCLGEILCNLHYTSECWTEPMNTSCKDAYLNQLATAETELQLPQLVGRLKALEQAFGRTPEKRKMGIVPIDLDVLLYDDEKLHLADWERPFCQMLMDELKHSYPKQ